MTVVHEVALAHAVHAVYWQLLVLEAVQVVAAVHVPSAGAIDVQVVATPTV